jgi:hypothetical protein
MKRKIAFLFGALASTSFGALVTVESLQTFDGTGDTGFLISPGVAVTTGSASVGIFSTLTDLEVAGLASSLNLAGLQAAFTALGTDTFSNVEANFGVANAGLVSIFNANFVPTPGETLYTLTTSGDKWAFFKHNAALTADPLPPSLPNSYNLSLSDGEILVGTSGGSYIADFTPLGGTATTTVANSIQLIPEPSAALLGALGALGLLRRRRI